MDKPIVNNSLSVSPNLSGVRVVLVEVDYWVRESIHMMLSMWGCRVLFGGSILSVADAVRETGFVPEIILSDLRLTGQIGEDAVQVIPPLLQRDDIRCPVILMTGDTDPGWPPLVKARAWKLLIKPFRPEELYVTMVDALRFV